MAQLSYLVAGWHSLALVLVLTLPTFAEDKAPATGADVIAVANAQAADGETDAAIATLQRWLADHPDDELVKNRALTMIARRDARTRLADTRLELAKNDSPLPQVEALVAANNHAEAISVLERWLADHPNDQAAKHRLLQLHIARKESEIRDLLRQQTAGSELMLEDPDYVSARRAAKDEVRRRLDKAEYLVSQRRYTEAGETCNRILADYPDEPATLRLKFRILDTVAQKEREGLVREQESGHNRGVKDVIQNASYPREKEPVKRQILIFDEDLNEVERAKVTARLQEKVTLNHNQAKVWDVMQQLFAVAGINYVVLDSALGDETLTLHLIDDTVESALNAISKLTKIRLAYHAGTVFVSSDANEGLVNDIIRLQSGLTDVSAAVTASSFDSGSISGSTSSGSNVSNGNQAQSFGGNQINKPSELGNAAAAASAASSGGSGGGSDLEKFIAKIPEQIVGWPSEGKIYLDRKSNSLFVKATPWAITELKRLLHAIDYNNVQVLIEARFIEVTDDAFDQLGIAWKGAHTSGGVAASSGSPSAFAPVDNGSILTGILSGGKVDFTATLKALQSQSKIDTLAEPKILTLNNATGQISITNNFTYIENYTTQVSTGSNQSSIVNNTVVTNSSTIATPQWGNTDTGYELKIQPSVARNSDVITLKLQPKIRQLLKENKVEDGFEYLPSSSATNTIKKPISKPTFSTRTLETTLHVENGQTVALGGLISEKNEQTSAGTPFFNRIPVLGHLFKTDTSDIKRSNLIILVTATIVDPSGAKVSDEIYRLRDTARVLLPATPGTGPETTADASPAAAPTEPTQPSSPGAPGKQRGHR